MCLFTLVLLSLIQLDQILFAAKMRRIAKIFTARKIPIDVFVKSQNTVIRASEYCDI